MQKDKQPSVKIGVFAGYDPRPWVMEQCADADARIVDDFVARVRARGYAVVYPPEDLDPQGRLCHTIPLANRYARIMAEAGCEILINVHPTWTFPQLSQKVITSFLQLRRAQEPGYPARVILASIQDTQVPGMVSGMATGGALSQIGVPYAHVAGDFAAAEFWRELDAALAFHARMADAHNEVRGIVNGLAAEHILEFGSFALQMPTTRLDHEEVMGRWGISSENLDQQVFLDRAFAMFTWAGCPGASAIVAVRDERVRRDGAALYDTFPEKFAAIPGRSVPRERFLLQLAIYYAIHDIAGERGATAVTVKCQDECSAHYCTCCLATGFLGNERGPDGAPKALIPASCETDLPTLLTQLFLTRLSGKPAGFGDFRYVKTTGDTTVLAIVNCGQHPPYYAGQETDPWEAKLAQIEFPGQEHFYRAGGAAVRMRTGGDQEVTIARLGVENGRLYLAASLMDTRAVDAERHKVYNEAWPIIEGTIPVSDTRMSRLWPSNHLGFVYGDYLPQLIELAQQLGIGYTVWDRGGRTYTKAP